MKGILSAGTALCIGYLAAVYSAMRRVKTRALPFLYYFKTAKRYRQTMRRLYIKIITEFTN